MSRNAIKRGTTEAELVQSAERAIRSALPASWSMTVDREPAFSVSGRVYRPDARVDIVASDGTGAVVLIECKGVVVPRDVALVAEQLNVYSTVAAYDGVHVGGAMLVAPFVSPTTRAQLDQRGLGWFDLTGNLRLSLDHPAVLIDRAGADRSGFRDPADRLLKSLRGPGAAKVVLELCETALPAGVRDLADRAGVSVSTSARVLELLAREAAIERNKDGVVTLVHKRSLVDRWAQDYNVTTSNEVITALDPRGLTHLLDSLSTVGAPTVLTGSAAARAYLPKNMTPVSPLVSVSLYAKDPLDLMSQVGLSTVERGTNVLVMRPYDDVVFAKSRHVEGLWHAAPAQVAADLLTGPGRSSEEAEQLMAMLGSVEPGWES